MWLPLLLALSIASAFLRLRTSFGRKYRLDVLALISGGAAVMFLVDSIYSYLEDGVFVELSTEALYLALTLVLSSVVIWLLTLALARPRSAPV